jgi:hypothetical protein
MAAVQTYANFGSTVRNLQSVVRPSWASGSATRHANRVTPPPFGGLGLSRARKHAPSVAPTHTQIANRTTQGCAAHAAALFCLSRHIATRTRFSGLEDQVPIFFMERLVSVPVWTTGGMRYGNGVTGTVQGIGVLLLDYRGRARVQDGAANSPRSQEGSW